MKVSVSPRRISRRVTKSVGMLFVLVLVVLAYASTAFAAGPQVSGGVYVPGEECPVGYHVVRRYSSNNPGDGYVDVCVDKYGHEIP